MSNLSAILFESLTVGQVPDLPRFSAKAKGTGYYGAANGIHSVQYSTSNQFNGQVKLQGTLISSPTEDDWFDIDGTNFGDPIQSTFDGAVIYNFVGNFVWVRAVITRFDAGGLNRVLLTHN